MTTYTATGSATINQGANDATANSDASTVSLRNIAYDNTTFANAATDNTFDLRHAANSPLINAGVNLASAGVTQDIEGTARLDGGEGYDIGAYEDGTPICWNYTANYRGSNKRFKMAGPGAFPKKLRIPDNVDESTGIMIDDGVLIDPEEYEVI